MDIKTLVFLVADAVMVLAGCLYGLKFLKKRNYLLGLEWLIVGLSGANFFLYSLTGSHFVYNISYFFDAFSRAFGFPVIATAGLMAVTHGYKPSTLADAGFFVASFVGAVILVAADSVAPAKPWFYLVMWTAYSIYLTHFSWRLLRAGEKAHAIGLFLVMLSSQVIASIYDFYKIPGDDDEHTLFYVLALSAWAYSLVETYYAYCALERAEATDQGARKAQAARLNGQYDQPVLVDRR